MGCSASKDANAELFIAKLKEETDYLQKVQTELASYNGTISDDQRVENMQKLQSEYTQSITNLKKSASLFPTFEVTLDQTLDQSLKPITFTPPIARPYIQNKLAIADIQTKILKELEAVIENLKKIEATKTHTNNSTIETLENLCVQASLTALLTEVQEIKSAQIEISSFRGGALDSILKRIEHACKIGIQLEIAQGKVEANQYVNLLASIVLGSDEFNEQMAEALDKRSSLNEAFTVINDRYQEFYRNELEPIDDKMADIDFAWKNTEKEIEKRNDLKLSKENKVEEIARMRVRLNYSESEITLLGVRNEETLKQVELHTQISKGARRAKKKIETRERDLKELHKEMSKFSKEMEIKVEEKVEKPVERDERHAQLERRLKDVTMSQTVLENALLETKAKRIASLRLQAVMQLRQAMKEKVEICFWMWRAAILIIDNSPPDEISEEDYRVADVFIAEQKEMILNSENVLMKFMDFQGVKPLEVEKLFKFLEELMDKKYEIDLRDINEGLLPMGFPDLVYNYIVGIFGIQKSAEKHLCRILMTLKQLAEENHLYALGFCQLFQVFTKDPVFYDFGVFLTRTRFDFQSIIYKYEKKVMSQGHKSPRGSREKSIEHLAKGGVAALSDVVDLIICIFENNKELGMIALQKIKPQSITLEEFVTFLICQKVARLNKSIESIFLAIDKDGSKTIDLKELTFFTRTSMDLWISEQDLIAGFMRLVKPGTKEISKTVFLETFSTDFFTKANDSEEYLVPKSNFLSVIIEIYNAQYRTEVARLVANLRSYSESISRIEFCDFISRIDNSFTSQSDSLYAEIVQENGKVKQFELISMIMKKGIGNWRTSPFSVHEMLGRLEEREDMSLRRSFVSYTSHDPSRAVSAFELPE